MERGGQYLSREDLAAVETADEVKPDDQLVADAADDVSAGRAPGEVATLDPGDGPAVEDELLEDAYEDLPGSGDDARSGPDEDDAEAWLDEGSPD
jgi:hypothetical protein